MFIININFLLFFFVVFKLFTPVVVIVAKLYNNIIMIMKYVGIHNIHTIHKYIIIITVLKYDYYAMLVVLLFIYYDYIINCYYIMIIKYFVFNLLIPITLCVTNW